METRSVRKKNYINNKDFYEALKAHRIEYFAAKEAGTELPKIPDYVGTAIYLIATKLSTKGNFVGYSFREEMIGDALENCFLYLYNFDPDKSNNPFAYFTQVIKFAFIRRINKERKQQYIKAKLGQNGQIQVAGSTRSPASDNEVMDDLIRSFEDKLATKKKEPKVLANTVTKFME